MDGQKLLDHRGEEERYLKSVMANFRQGLLQLKDDLLVDGARIVEFPRIWIMALSKADLFPDWDVDTFRDLVIGRAAQDVDRLRSTIEEFVDTPAALSVGDDFMLSSSAKFKPDSNGTEPAEIDVTKQFGLDLILPVASLLPLERRVQWNAKMDIPRKVLDSLADGADLLAAALAGGRFAPVEKILAKVPKIGGAGGKAALVLLASAAEMAVGRGLLTDPCVTRGGPVGQSASLAARRFRGPPLAWWSLRESVIDAICRERTPRGYNSARLRCPNLFH